MQNVEPGDVAWVLVSTVLVLLMTVPGLALFYAGMVRKKNVLAIMMQSFFLCAAMTVVWMVAGYSLAFGNGNAWIGDFSRLFLNGLADGWDKPFTLGAGTTNALPTTIPESVFVMFQMAFAIITPAVVTGSCADRMKFSALMMLFTMWSLVVYAPLAHWVWSPNGWLAVMGAFDQFFVVDVRAHYKYNENLEAALGVDNLNNAKYWEYHPFPQRTFIGELKMKL